MGGHLNGVARNPPQSWAIVVAMRFGYPRPQLQRRDWLCLNGAWRFTFDDERRYSHPGKCANGRLRSRCRSRRRRGERHRRHRLLSRLLVPARGRACRLVADDRVLLHFGAVDYVARVWVNGRLAGVARRRLHAVHADITHSRARRANARRSSCAPRTIRTTSRSRAASRTGSSSRTPSGIRAPRASGRPCGSSACRARRSASVRWTSKIERYAIALRGAASTATRRERLRARRRCSALGDRVLADDRYVVDRRRGPPAHHPVRSRHRRLPQRDAVEPRAARRCIDARIRLLRGRTRCIDEVRSYTRAAQRGRAARPLHAERPAATTCAWCSTRATGRTPGCTAPSDDALRRDVELAKAMGFNGVRKHQKIEDPRYLYWADTLGLLVWEEMPRAYRFTRTSIKRLTREWTEVDRPRLQPPVHRSSWVPFNESWGVPDLPAIARAAALRAGALPPHEDARPDASGDRQRRLGERRDRHHRHPRLRRRSRAHRARYGTPDVEPQLFEQAAPGRAACSRSRATRTAGQPIMLTECGGIAYRCERRDEHVGLLARRTTPTRSRDATRRSSRRCSDSPLLRRLLLHAVRRHVSRKPTACCSRIARRRFPSSSMRRVNTISRTFIPGGV